MIKNGTLKFLNSFAIDVCAQCIVAANTKIELFKFWQKAKEYSMPVIVLGSGSNVLFLENYDGTVLLNRITGITIEERSNAWYLHVGAGEIWHNLVNICLKKRIPGLENLALIPGRVGSAPIQNIGAYGVELQRFCNYVDVLQLTTGKTFRLSVDECQFDYRDSIFKHSLREEYAIISIGLQLSKFWEPVLTHSDLSHLKKQKITQKTVYDIVCMLRRKKLPDPTFYGNAGSFFKNPTINISNAATLLNCYPDTPYYPQLDKGKVKLSAGWLIDACGLKGYQLGGAAIHKRQALILININCATGKDVAKLAHHVRQKVAEKFSVCLEPEVRFIGARGEIDALRAIT
ncbi:UDP-N-acetylmuramate dehydrogenase [Sodalis sp. CWE]|uniref:UDP-N-acetylmuramate dehydrogenase n=1 Tax=Sodalis sp. CWE TaxID=2803816 RepID=UPI001C7D1DE3|nr:UDP-N-acetylmuramate dehydrogenase [Sodalis sp. CWE]MBX4181216.1 UDP-N-acetylmuramate dehydrogenase [Sodalis sp. CWE]